jgi:N-acetylmuramoyl-L-alanine amidase
VIVSPLAHRVIEAANREPRRNGRTVDMLLLHYTGMNSAGAACDLLCSEASGVSCHYLIDEDGAITQMVGEESRAWHAGASSWQGETDTNSRSIGIEIQNPGHQYGYRDFPAVQMAAVVALSRDILTRHAIQPPNVLAHSDVAPGRKIDPGERFDWSLLHRAGIGHWVPPAERDERVLAGAALAAFQQILKDYGYAIAVTGEHDEATRKVTDAFQRHFRQALVNGIPDYSALRTAERLTAALVG